MSKTIPIKKSIKKKQLQSLLENIDEQPIDKQRTIFSQVLQKLGVLTEKDFEDPDKLVFIIYTLEHVSDLLWVHCVQSQIDLVYGSKENG